MIEFVWKGRKYQVGQIAYNVNLIRLPDKTLLKVSGWLESMPPKPTGLKAIDPEQRGGILATEIQ